MEPINRALPPDAGDRRENEIKELERVAAQRELSHGARGALLVAGIAVSLLFIGWMLFYFLLFMRRGYVG